MTIEKDHEITTRLQNFLHGNNIVTAAELSRWTEAQILRQDNMGRVTLREIKKILALEGLSLASDTGDLPDSILPPARADGFRPNPFSLTERQTELIDEISAIHRRIAPIELQIADLRLRVRDFKLRQAELVTELLKDIDTADFVKAVISKMQTPKE